MPFCALEYQIGQLYTIAKKSKLESGNGDPKNGGSGGGVKIITNEPYSFGPGGTSGQYTKKTYYLASRVPDWIKRLLPDSAAKLNEEAWNAYPYSKNKFTNPLCDKLQLEIESRYVDGPPIIENVFNLSAKEANERSIVMIDFVCDKYKGKRGHAVAPSSARSNNQSGHHQSNTNNDNNHHHPSASSSCSPAKESPSVCACGAGDGEILNFEPLFRGSLSKNWLQEYELAYSGFELTTPPNKQPASGDRESIATSAGATAANINDFNANGIELTRRLMTCYKLVRINFPVWPIQSKVEHFIQQYCRDTILESHKQTWLWQDEWTGMSLEQIRQMERETQSHLVEVMQTSTGAQLN